MRGFILHGGISEVNPLSTDLAEAALAYARAGLAVVPILAGSKRPLRTIPSRPGQTWSSLCERPAGVDEMRRGSEDRRSPPSAASAPSQGRRAADSSSSTWTTSTPSRPRCSAP